MALEYVMHGDADLSSAELRAFYAAAIEGELSPDGTVFRPGMYVMARRVKPEEENPMTQLLGFEHRINATYRFRNLSEPAEQDHNTIVMASSILSLADRYGGRGVLLFNGERVVLQWDPDEVVFDSEWEDWSEIEEAFPLVAAHQLRPLPQPLL